MKIIGLAVLALAILASPALAQHGRGGERGGQRGEQRGEQRGDRGPDGHRYTDHERIVHRHYDGRRFDGDYRYDHFGRGHIFGLHLFAFGVGGYRFQYGDFWFGVPYWPEGWIRTDGVYIEQDGDIVYLYNIYHPGVRIALTVIL